jgi:hypothetical protein
MARAQYNPTIASIWSAPVRGRVSLLFEYNVWVSRQSRFANDQIESATRRVQTAAELTRNRVKGYRGRGVAVCELVYIRENFFLAGMSLVGTLRSADRLSNCLLVGADRK